MSLILVIVADPHEATQLAKLIQGRLSVDLVQAAEVGEGLLALEDRIPDLILTSPLLSPFDDGVLDEYLRDLGPAGAHVQTLRIPVLSQAPKKAKRFGFSLGRSKPEAPTITGCEPKVFADEIEQYLVRAAEEKRHVASNDQPVIIGRQAIAPAPEVAEEQWTAAYSEDAPTASASWSEPEPEAEPVAWRADLLDRPPVEETPIYQPPSPVVAYEEPAIDYVAPIQEDAVAPQYEPIATPYEPVATDHDQTPVETATPWQEDVVEEPPVAVSKCKPAASAANENNASPSFKAALAAIRAAWGKPPRKNGSHVTTAEPAPPAAKAEPVIAAVDPSAPFEVDLTGAIEVLDEEPIDVDIQATSSQRASIEPVADTADVYELSVEPDLSELESKLITSSVRPSGPQVAKSAPPAQAVEEPKAIESAPAPVADVNGDSKKKGKRPAKNANAVKPGRQEQAQPQAAQNEWGMFDPNQCGFAALVDKLDEVAKEKADLRRNGTKIRVISLS